MSKAVPFVKHPTPPGEILVEEFLLPLALSQAELARRLGCHPRTINEICKGKRAISPTMALLLASAFDVTPEFWINMQSAYDLWQAYEKSLKRHKAG